MAVGGTSAASSSSSGSSVNESTSTTTASAIVISPNETTINPGASLQFSATGGTAPYTYSIVEGGGSISATSGLYTAPDVASSIEIGVTDADENYAYTTLTVSQTDLTITANSASVVEGGTDLITGNGGTPPYAFFVASGAGTIDQTSGLYTAASTTGDAEISIIDASGAVAYKILTITAN